MENGIILSRHTSSRLTAHQCAAAHRLRSTGLGYQFPRGLKCKGQFSEGLKSDNSCPGDQLFEESNVQGLTVCVIN